MHVHAIAITKHYHCYLPTATLLHRAVCVYACVQEAHEELRMLQRKGAVAPPSLVPNAGEDDYNRLLHDDRLLSADSFDFTRSKPLTPDPGTIAATAHMHKCPGRRQGKSGFSGMCEIFNEFELHFQVCRYA
jgi:hypothetical protein